MLDAELPSDRDNLTRAGDGIARGRLRRASSLASLTARTAGESIVGGVRARLTGAEDPEFHARTAERYAELLGHSKGVLMKAGQMLSFLAAAPASSADVQSIYQTALSRLGDEAPPMGPELARSVLERELGRPAEQAFAQFDWSPLAAASIGQVHAGLLHDGRAVAVKIQYPGAAQAIRSDLKNVELLATFASLAFGMFSRISFDVRAAAGELGVRILEELDYQREMNIQAEFAEHYRGHPFIHVPDVICELCTERVLTQQLVTGRNWQDALASPAELRDQWGEAIYRFTYGSFARLRLLHADPHPGNYLFHDDGSVSFLDFGCVKRFSRAQIEACQATFRAGYIRNDALETWQAGVRAGLWCATDRITPEEALLLWRGLRGYFCEQQPLTLTPEHVAKWVAHCSPDGPLGNAARNVSSSMEYTLMPRVEMGTLSLLAQLRATSDWRALLGEWMEEDVSLTAMGKRERSFDEQRTASDPR